MEAQCGIQFTQNKLTFGAAPTVLQISIPNTWFEGTVSFTGGANALRTAAIPIVPSFPAGADLLKFTYRPNTQGAPEKTITWTIEGKAPARTTLKNVTFGKVITTMDFRQFFDVVLTNGQLNTPNLTIGQK